MLATLWFLVKATVLVVITATVLGWLYGKTPEWFKAAVSGAISGALLVARKWIGL